MVHLTSINQLNIVEIFDIDINFAYPCLLKQLLFINKYEVNENEFMSDKE
jgi:hypothetical protein